jgi:hypothetical protein
MKSHKLLVVLVKKLANSSQKKKSLLGMLNKGYTNEVFSVQRWVENIKVIAK